MTTGLGHGRGWAADDCAQAIFRIDAVLGRPLEITSAGRTKAQNDKMIADWNAGRRAGLVYPPSPNSPHLSGEAIDTDDHAWMLANGRPFGFGHDVAGDVVHFVYHASLDQHRGGGTPARGTVPTSSWSVGETDFKGAYGENALNGARWYCIEPVTSGEKTIWGVANAHGLTLAQVSEWTAKVAASKWGRQLLQAGSSWWDGSGTYYAGVCIALNDVAAALDAYAAAQALAVPITPAPAPVPSPAAVAPPKAKAAPKVATMSQAELDAYAASINVPPLSADAGLTAPLSGLFAGHGTGRKRAYLAYATAVLVISFGPDVITVGLLTDAEVPFFAKIVQLATSVLLKIGAALGFIAASNTEK